MPILEGDFKPSIGFFKNPHTSTIYASLLRWLPRIKFDRERIHTPDKDFLDLDWLRSKNDKLVVILSGLEGKSDSLYSRAAIKYFFKNSWDCVCMNYRGCSGEPNNLLNGYHMGASGDVKFSIDHILKKYNYEKIILLGYSLGGNIVLKYLGEEAQKLPKQIKASISYSVPMAIKQSNERLSKWYNWHYLKWFMMPLNYKANKKKKQYPNELKDYKGFFMSGNFTIFDTLFTAPANGFKSVEEYWKKSSCKPFLDQIKIPSLVINALNDTFISKQCYPFAEAEKNPKLFLEINKFGGHCGFIRKFFEKDWWMEERALTFANEHMDLE